MSIDSATNTSAPIAATLPCATIDDLARVESKAELINGRIVHLMATGHRPNVIAGRIFRRLAEYAETIERGVAYTDNMGFVVGRLSSGRQSFAPDVSYYTGPLPKNLMRFVEGAPDLAVEVRSENDYGDAAEAEIVAKRTDYFEAGTKVVWDVDPRSNIVCAFVAGNPTQPTIFSVGEQAHAEPAVPGWRIATDWLFA